MKILQTIGKFFKDLFKQSIQAQLDILVPIAKEIVTKVESDPSIILDKGKQATAVSLLLAELAAKELQFVPRLINLAIEIAVVDYKGIQ
ncbi:hypothetical protein UFOVP84_26 [uncultured Caudovirales phage]|uniref:Uncharacterized protein n=1 Tax=uncultured Caudovirales phage TaxID=2100421 RepID=A0A6J5L0M6_9CAUD|nr:hypothetical protein UFOVP84_26 [uncultured Caudovirales phage]